MAPSRRRILRKIGSVTEDHFQWTPEGAFRFLDLPVTIRQFIYEFLFTAPRGFVRLFHKIQPYCGSIVPTKISINILFTCRTVYIEACLVLYRVNTFCIRPLQNNIYRRNEMWIHDMHPECRDAVRKLEVRLPTSLIDMKNYEDMSGLFTHLREIVFFFDCHWSESNRISRMPATKLVEYYSRLLARLPKAKVMSFDMELFGYRSHAAPLINAITKAWNAANSIQSLVLKNGESVYLKLERDNYVEVLFQQYKVTQYILEEHKQDTTSSIIRYPCFYTTSKEDRAMDDTTTDDDTEDEHTYGLRGWNLQDAAVKRLAQHASA